MATKIEWTDRTWNPVTGCAKISPGCVNCYMFRDYARLRGMGVKGYQTTPEDVVLHPDRLFDPYRWRKAPKVFVCSMSDLFHPAVPYTFIHQVFVVMATNPHVTFQLLTKRPKTMAHFARTYHPPLWEDRGTTWQDQWPANVWAGTSVESAEYLWRLDALARVPAKVRFVSCEPLLGPQDLRPWLEPEMEWEQPQGAYRPVGKPVLQWVIMGGESGSGARPMHPQWARDIRDQCQEAGVPLFFKQWGAWRGLEDGDITYSERHQYGYSPHEVTALDGAWVPYYNEAGQAVGRMNTRTSVIRVGKKAAGSLLDGREWREMPDG